MAGQRPQLLDRACLENCEGNRAPPQGTEAYFDKARYCEARIVLDNGKTATAYYRLNVLKGGKAQDWVEPCFKSVNDKVMQDGCVEHRPRK